MNNKKLFEAIVSGEAEVDYHDGTNEQDFIVPHDVGSRETEERIKICELSPEEAFALGVVSERMKQE